VPGRHSREDAQAVLDQLELTGELPATVRAQLDLASAQPPTEARGWQVLIGDNRLAAEAAAERARSLGFQTAVLTNQLEGEAAYVGYLVAALAKSVQRHADPVPAPACLILGGETTVTVRGDGLGGRNQELALAAAIGLDGWPNLAVATLATDGVDGPTPAAGAVVSGDTVAQAHELGLDPEAALQTNDSHTLLHAIGADLLLGPTGTNVNDLIFVLVYPTGD
jgi:hydroxypyruvate reductase